VRNNGDGIARTDSGRGQRGAALLIAIMAILLVTALGTALLVAASIESKITRNFSHSSGALYAADAVLERAAHDLSTMSDWNAALSGVATSAFLDGLPGGARTLADGQRLDIAEVANRANCRQAAACSGAAMDAATAERPWGPNNPRWTPFAWGWLDGMSPGGAIRSPFYVVAMVADDPSENDGDPLSDGAVPCIPGETHACNPGTDRIGLRAEAFGPFGAHRIIELTLARRGAGEHQPDYNNGGDQAGVRILSWRELR
jgi:hypothetical protein